MEERIKQMFTDAAKKGRGLIILGCRRYINMELMERQTSVPQKHHKVVYPPTDKKAENPRDVRDNHLIDPREVELYWREQEAQCKQAAERAECLRNFDIIEPAYCVMWGIGSNNPPVVLGKEAKQKQSDLFECEECDMQWDLIGYDCSGWNKTQQLFNKKKEYEREIQG
jgi:hypothetical protein